MNFSRFLKSPSAAGLSPPQRPWGWGERKREPDQSHRPPRAFYFCFLLERGSRVRDREKDLFREFATREDGYNSGNQKNSSGSKRTCWNVFVQHGRKVLRIGWKLDEIFKHCKSIWTRNLFSQKKLYKSCIITDFCKHQRIHYCKGPINLALSNPFGKHLWALLSLVYRPGYFLYVFRSNSPFGLSQM